VLILSRDLRVEYANSRWTIWLETPVGPGTAFASLLRENVAFEGKGEQTRFIHERYPNRACAIALEFKKFFMDEWTGTPDRAEVAAMRAFVAHITATAEDLLSR